MYLYCLYVPIMIISKMDWLCYKSCLNEILLYSINEKYMPEIDHFCFIIQTTLEAGFN